jgi:dipeptidyl aminopeptidase/acylaminoacyl peptidase
MTDATAAALTGRLPDRSDDVVRGLSEAFRPSHVDALPNSVCWYRDRWLISADIWGDRRLAQFDASLGTWSAFPAPAGWIRRPMTVGGDHLSLLWHEHHADQGRQLELRGDRWETVVEGVDEFTVTDWNGRQVSSRDAGGSATAWAAGGEPIRLVARPDGPQAIVGPGWEIPIPPGATLSHLSPSPDRSTALAVVRRGSNHQAVVVSLHTGQAVNSEPLRHVVQPISAWLDETRVVLVVEEWPSLVPVVWDWARASLDRAWALGSIGTVRSVAATPGGTCVVALGTPSAQRGISLLDDTSPLDQATGSQEVRFSVVRRGDQLLPCVVHEPSVSCRGTVFFLPGGPHLPIWGDYASLAGALSEAGWRVVRVNVRSSGLRQAEYRPAGPVRFGVDDVADLCTVIDALADGPVVTMGMSYGSYIAALAGELSDRCVGVAVLGGFLHPDDLVGTGHAGVRQFAELAFRDRPPLGADHLRKRYFIAHGELDARIPIAAVERHRSRMDQELTFVPLEGEGHVIRTDRGARLTYPSLIRWLSELTSARRW